MQLVEKHIIKKNHSFYSECDQLCFKSKNIYNLSLYKVREGFFINDYEPLNRLFHHMKHEECFKELPMKISTATIIQVQKIFKGYFKAIKEYGVNPNKFLGKPKLPTYKDKLNGRNITSYNNQAISKLIFKKENKILLSGTNIKFYTKIKEFNQLDCVRIIPRIDHYVIEVVYTIDDIKLIRENKRYVAIDLGVNNLATLTSNIKEIKPTIINGKPLKSINQYFNKKKGLLQSKLNKGQYISKRINKLTNKRNNKVNDYLHKKSKQIVDKLKENNINKLIIGKNDNWKNESKMNTKSNQNFISIPHNTFINMLEYKCKKSGIKTILQEESYTSKASFLNLDPIPTYGTDHNTEFSGYRESRGMYKIKGEKLRINADVNGSYNILRKAVPNAFANGIEGIVVYPVVLKP